MPRQTSSVGFASLLCFLLVACNNGCIHKEPCFVDNGMGLKIKQGDEAEEALLKYINDRTVRIVCSCKIVDPQTGKLIRDYKPSWWGTGNILKSSKVASFVQTAYHVVKKMEFTASAGKYICDGRMLVEKRDLSGRVTSTFKDLKVVKYSGTDDIALVRIKGNLGVSSKFSKKIYLGQNIRILGFPSLRGVNGTNLSYSKGYIATILKHKKNNKISNLSRFAAFAYYGNSGSAVWNTKGEIVGLVTSLSGFRTFGGFVPQQDRVYGPNLYSLINFYKDSSLSDMVR